MKVSKEHVKSFINCHRFSIAYGIMVISSLCLLPAFNAGTQGDMNLYQGIANDVFKGLLPYRDRALEYPPYAIPIFLLPRIFGENNYSNGFAALVFVADWLIKLMLFALGLRGSKTVRALLPLLLYSGAIPFLRFFLLQRYDIYPALICLAAIWLLCSRHYFLCGLTIAIGIGVKLYPVVFVPPLFILAARHGKWKSFTIGLTAGLLPIVLLSFYLPWWRFAEFQGNRGLQVECFYASLLWLGKLLGLVHLHWAFVDKKWYEVHGAAAAAVLPWARLLWIGAVGVSILVSMRVATRVPVPKEKGGSETNTMSIPQVARLLLIPLLAFVAFNQVLSPQYMIWLLPLAALTGLEGNIAPAPLISVATMLTPLFYPSLFGDYGSGLGLFEVVILLARNLILILVWALLIFDLRAHKLTLRLGRSRRSLFLDSAMVSV